MRIIIITFTSLNNYSHLFYLLGIPLLLGYTVIQTYGKNILNILTQLTVAYFKIKLLHVLWSVTNLFIPPPSPAPSISVTSLVIHCRTNILDHDGPNVTAKTDLNFDRNTSMWQKLIKKAEYINQNKQLPEEISHKLQKYLLHLEKSYFRQMFVLQESFTCGDT